MRDSDHSSASLFVPCYPERTIVFARGRGSRLIDTDDREYIDFGSGIAVTALGHCHPKIVQAIGEQAAQLQHTSNLYGNVPGIRLAEWFIEHTFAQRVFFCNSGAEANEAAIKLARRYGGNQHRHKYRIASFHGSFHGRLGFSMMATGQPKIYEGFGPLADGFIHLPFNDIETARERIDDTVCGVIIEPIQGEAGIYPATGEFLSALREICDRHQALLIFDEIQCGVGRTGYLYDYIRHGITPDLLTTAKGLGGGTPVGALLASDDAASHLSAGSHGTTFGGNALSAHVALTVLSVINTPSFLADVRARGEFLAAELAELQNAAGISTRHEGLLFGITLPESIDKADVIGDAAAAGLLVLPANGNAIRLAPALNIPQEDIAEGMEILKAVLSRYA